MAKDKSSSPTKYTKPLKYSGRLKKLGESARGRGKALAKDFVRLGKLRKERGSWPAYPKRHLKKKSRKGLSK